MLDKKAVDNSLEEFFCKLIFIHRKLAPHRVAAFFHSECISVMASFTCTPLLWMRSVPLCEYTESVYPAFVNGLLGCVIFV